MAFAYYKRLSAEQKRIYRRSDAVSSIKLPEPSRFHGLIQQLEGALTVERRSDTQAACQQLLDALTRALQIGPVKIKVLAARPSKSWGELHGLYYPSDGASVPSITVWMRTAQQRRVVAFKSFLRTVLHEFGHHLDYALLKLEDSFHTEGFYKRESSLFHQLTGSARPAASSRKPTVPPNPEDGAGYDTFQEQWASLKAKLDPKTGGTEEK